ncbi:MAG: glycosyltransferase [Solirubrobacterales bacterium]
MPHDPAIHLSVVIPTRDRPALVADCLATLLSQEEPPGGMEILLIDDGSAEPLTMEGAGHGSRVRCVRQDAQGLNVARNRGVAEARGKLLAFLDDDTLVRPGWASAVAEGFAVTGCDALGGRITLQFESDPPPWLTPRQFSFLSHYDLGPEPQEVSTRVRLPFGANFAVRRETLERLGGFRPDLDRIGSTLISNGETELLLRIVDENGKIAYWPAADVAHRVPAERLTKSWFQERALAQGVSDVRTIPPGKRTDSIIRTLLVARQLIFIAGSLPGVASRLARERSRFDQALWWTYCRGRIDEAKRFRLRP